MIRSLPLALAAVVALPACLVIGPHGTSGDGSGGSGSTTSATTTSTSTGKGCDAQSSCDACVACATKGACSSEVAACDANSACVGLVQCLDLCGMTADCKAQCAAQNQVGVADYDRLIACVYCDACPNTCAGSASCGP